jgi:hypothetical protein
MQVIKILNQIIAFLLEVAMLTAFCYYGYINGATLFWKYALAIGLPLVIVLLWSKFAAPKSASRLKPIPLLIFKLFITISCAVFLYFSQAVIPAACFITIGVLSVWVGYFLGQ